jgi:hypothetical protein
MRGLAARTSLALPFDRQETHELTRSGARARTWRGILPFALALTLLLSVAPPARGVGTVVRHVIRTSQWDTPSPDPTGIDFLPSGKLLVTDSEVEETRLDEHRNVWRITRGGRVERTMHTLRFSREPTDVAADGRHNRWFFSDDHGLIFIIRLGPDHTYGTNDDRRRSFSTADFGSLDPEGLAFDGGYLWLSDGSNRRIYRIDPGPNGRFEGADAGRVETDDIIKKRQLDGLGVRDLEGVERAPNGHLFVLPGVRDPDILEIDFSDGSLIRRYDLTSAHLRNPSSIAYGPSSRDASRRSVYITDRGVDNQSDPNENDGRIVEVGIRR